MAVTVDLAPASTCATCGDSGRFAPEVEVDLVDVWGEILAPYSGAQGGISTARHDGESAIVTVCPACGLGFELAGQVEDQTAGQAADRAPERVSERVSVDVRVPHPRAGSRTVPRAVGAASTAVPAWKDHATQHPDT